MLKPEIDPADRDYLSYNWCSLEWSDWVPFNADKHTFHTIPDEPGVYRIRPAGKDFLLYVGETGRPLHQKLNDLRQNLRRGDLMPWSDPHAEAPALWAYWTDWLSSQEAENAEGHQARSRRMTKVSGLETREDDSLRRSSDLRPKPQVSSTIELIAEEEREQASRGSNRSTAQEQAASEENSGTDIAGEPAPVMLECSAAPLDASAAGRKGMEAFLLYRYRQERGESPLCNFGRFHPRYRRSTNRKEGRRGAKLRDDQQDNPAGFPSFGPLEATGTPGEPDWMGLEWPASAPLVPANIDAVAPGAGLYLLADAGSDAILYIGQSADLKKRLGEHSRKAIDGRMLEFTYQVIGQAVLPHNLRELENDLVGDYFRQMKRAPEFQYRGGR